ncbi:type II toxin-antitoxin system RelE/ParE family toxin [Adlercreutzia sp. R25]|uniref:Type II toxin-antitoxin system RelE/ParE family toxin n=1 Tax=Adlercreutzia shanghongiae TaxID=3111773 RepID=A0ABU6IY95_9ACTN|nr:MULTISPECIES: type II toxin-antitoxin system RelE/ParE family toxin [unclassified Adlercreutzia]MEC4271807.1 type II toxin-antitoxin system RelE/ParE family toxin [Adlercreutzia sp. R25]MEC4294814.1 type II toxin-antitoxin system RelE/ParE family toxin [Adlercreutzia sp. R22]
MGEKSHGHNPDIPIDLYKENRIKSWQVDMAYIEDWLDTLDDESVALVLAAVGVLREQGPLLKRPLVGAIEGSRFKNMKELRPGSAGVSEIRILFAFDPRRHAILLLGGDKRGQWRAWYKRAIPEADRRFAEHLETMR